MLFYWQWCLLVLLSSSPPVQSLCPRQSGHVLRKRGETFGPALTRFWNARGWTVWVTHCLGGSEPGRDSSSSAPALLSVFLQLVSCQRNQSGNSKSRCWLSCPLVASHFRNAARFLTSPPRGEYRPRARGTHLFSSFCIIFGFCVFSLPPLYPFPAPAQLFFPSFLWEVFINCMAQVDVKLESSCLSLPIAGIRGTYHFCMPCHNFLTAKHPTATFNLVGEELQMVSTGIGNAFPQFWQTSSKPQHILIQEGRDQPHKFCWGHTFML